LLFADFGIDIELPLGFLSPGVPGRYVIEWNMAACPAFRSWLFPGLFVFLLELTIFSLSLLLLLLSNRLDYLHWIEDLLGPTSRNNPNVVGIDVGSGASCIYPLLGSALNRWHFYATESNQQSYEYCCRNASLRSATIDCLKVSEDAASILPYSDIEAFDFVVCNPPFDTQGSDNDNREIVAAVGATSPDRHLGKPWELMSKGGEITMLNRLLDESVKLPLSYVKGTCTKSPVFSMLIGRVSSLPVARKVLEDAKTRGELEWWREHCMKQGRTERWAIAWSPALMECIVPQ
jgi:23S rRNA A1618 N6-methylase RlmF